MPPRRGSFFVFMPYLRRMRFTLHWRGSAFWNAPTPKAGASRKET